MDKLKALLKKYREPISYIFWGVLTTAISFITYSLFTLLFTAFLDTKAAVFISNALSWVSAVLFAFITNKLWVFNSKSFEKAVVLPEFLKFLSSRIATGVIEIAGLPLLISLGLDATIFGIEGLLAKIVINIIVIVLNYVFSKLIIFKK
ncbi:MAG: GtrA family protein [Oscillospiraceae bacterium]|nr:GtrA family protein [Oscillospiraceae bacterium]